MTLDTNPKITRHRQHKPWPVSRVCLVGPLPPPSGGMAEQTRQLAYLLSEEGVQVDIVQVNAPYSKSLLGRIRGVRAISRLIPYLFRLWNAIGEASIVHVMANSGWSWYLHAAPAIWIAHFRKTPVIVNYRGGGAAEFLRNSAQHVLPTLKKAQALILPSSFLLAVFDQFGVAGRIVPNIVDLSKFKSSHKGKPLEAPHVVVTRNLEEIYGIDIALKAFKLILKTYPAARMTVAGIGDQAKNLYDLARELNIDNNVAFVGRLDRDGIIALYQDADLLLNASRIDNMPNSLLEALASGIPIVSTKAGGIPHMVTHQKTAMLVEIDDFQAMAESSISVLYDKELRSSLIKNGLAEAQKYSWESVSDCLATAYAESIAHKSAVGRQLP